MLVIAAFVALKLASSDKYAQTRTEVLEKYLSYTDTDAVTYEDYLESTNGNYVSDSAKEITVKAADYKTADMEELKQDGDIVWTAGRTIVRNAKRRCEIENAKSEEFDIDYATERRGQYDYRPDYTDKH